MARIDTKTSKLAQPRVLNSVTSNDKSSNKVPVSSTSQKDLMKKGAVASGSSDLKNGVRKGKTMFGVRCN